MRNTKNSFRITRKQSKEENSISLGQGKTGYGGFSKFEKEEKEEDFKGKTAGGFRLNLDLKEINVA